MSTAPIALVDASVVRIKGRLGNGGRSSGRVVNADCSFWNEDNACGGNGPDL